MTLADIIKDPQAAPLPPDDLYLAGLQWEVHQHATPEMDEPMAAYLQRLPPTEAARLLTVYARTTGLSRRHAWTTKRCWCSVGIHVAPALAGGVLSDVLRRDCAWLAKADTNRFTSSYAI